ncbi:MAG: methyltransferase, TIGR04325 family [Pseudaminobacter sp.]
MSNNSAADALKSRAGIRPQAVAGLKGLVRGARAALMPARMAIGRLRLLSPLPLRFSGAYASHAQALSAPAAGRLAGYDHDEIAEVSFDKMCQVVLWDYPVLFWLERLLPQIDCLVDAGGHMGTKFRAFRPLLPIDGKIDWIVYDLPAIVRAGKARATREGLSGLSFTDDLATVEGADLFLASGLLQYLDVPMSDLLRRLPSLPRHLLINKLAVRDGETVVTLERIGKAMVPYQIRNRQNFMAELASLGYRVVDSWTIPSLSHVIDTHPELGASQSMGLYLRLD